MASPLLNLVEFSNPENAQEPARSPFAPTHIPDSVAMMHWRISANAVLENTLAEFDQDLVGGQGAETVAQQAIERFMDWTRKSIADHVPPNQSRSIGASLRQQEQDHWEQLALQCVATAGSDPDGVDRFLRIWLAVIHEASATGFAGLYAEGASPKL